MKKLFFILISAALIFTGCKKSDSDVVVYNPATDGIVGEWYSSGTNVALLLVNLMKTDSIYAKFNADKTYYVESFDKAKVKTVFTGVYTQSKSSVGNIWTIKLSQSKPAAITTEGIFEISGTGPKFMMKYEVVQTEPDIKALLPTPQKGFGADYKGTNVQTYIKIVK